MNNTRKLFNTRKHLNKIFWHGVESSLRTENSWHFTTPPLVSREYNYVWETNAGTLYWWCVTTQIWVVHLIGWSKFSTNQKHHSDLGKWCVISMEFLCRRDFGGKPVVAPRNVGWFLRLRFRTYPRKRVGKFRNGFFKKSFLFHFWWIEKANEGPDQFCTVNCFGSFLTIPL